MDEPVSVQPQVQTYARSLGEVGRQWLASLPAAVPRICGQWNLERGEPLPGGSRSYVCRVTTSDGQRAVLKLALPEPVLESQFSTLIAAQGRGYVEILARDLRQGALLMESLGASALEPGTPDLFTLEAGGGVPAVLSRLAGTLRQAWQVPLALFPAVQTPAEHKAAGLSELLGELVAGNADLAPAAVVTQALDYARARLLARDPARQVVVHGDAHAGNLLQTEQARPGAETGYVFVDPEGFRCEPEYDLGVALREWNIQLLAAADPQADLRSWCDLLAQATDTDAEAIWQWAYLERVSTGLYLAHHGLSRLGAPFLDTARRLLE